MRICVTVSVYKIMAMWLVDGNFDEGDQLRTASSKQGKGEIRNGGCDV